MIVGQWSQVDRRLKESMRVIAVAGETGEPFGEVGVKVSVLAVGMSRWMTRA